MAGTYSFTVRVTDAARATILNLFRLTITFPPAPPVTISGLPDTAAAPAEQYAFRVSIGSAYPAPLTGEAVLSFAPDSGPGDSTIQFASGGRTAAFSIPQDSLEATSAIPLAIQTGTVAGTYHRLCESTRRRSGHYTRAGACCAHAH